MIDTIICFSGHIKPTLSDSLTNREDLKRRLRALGCDVQPYVVPGVSLLVTGEKPSTHALGLAESFGIRVVPGKEFLVWLRGAEDELKRSSGDNSTAIKPILQKIAAKAVEVQDRLNTYPPEFCHKDSLEFILHLLDLVGQEGPVLHSICCYVADAYGIDHNQFRTELENRK